MNDLTFTPQAFKEYVEWQAEDRKTLKKMTLPTPQGGESSLERKLLILRGLIPRQLCGSKKFALKDGVLHPRIPINALIEDIQRDGLLEGIGKPEPLKHLKACSRHIDEANRLIYTADGKQNPLIMSCKGHYQ
jgi:toxin YoeB